MTESFAAIRILQQQYQLTQAIESCLAELAIQPNTELTALLGTLYAQNKQKEQAQDCLTQLITQNEPLSHLAITDMAGICLLLGQPQQALAHLNTVLDENPEFVLAVVRRGLVLMQIGHYQAAISGIKVGLTQLPVSYHDALALNLARCYLDIGETETALNYFNQATEQGAINKPAWIFLAVDCYVALNEWTKAEQAIQQALDQGLHENLCWQLLAVVLAAQNKHDEAKHQLRKALEKQPNHIAFLIQLADIAAVRGHYGEAIHAIRTALKVEPENPSLWTQLAHLGKYAFNENLPRNAAQKAIEITKDQTGLERAQALVALAAVNRDDGELEQAQDLYRQALALIVDYPPACLGLGHLFLQWGKINEAIAQFETVMAKHPLAGYGALINARQFPDDPNILKRIEAMAYIPSLQGPVASGLLFDLAAVYEHRKEYDKAFHFAHEANRTNRDFLPYDSEKHHQFCLALRHTFTRHFFTQRAAWGNNSTLPVFILGMPRSGTTLVEQILGGHPNIFVAGEIGILSTVIQKLNAWEKHLGSNDRYPTCVTQLTADQVVQFAQLLLEELQPYAPTAQFIVDKLPHNFEHIGLIRLLFPQAKIIHVLREPRDVAVSNYFTDYQAKFGGMGFAYDLIDIGKQLVDYRELMAHWEIALMQPILTIRYEELVTDIVTQAHRLLDYLGLAWTDTVLNYQNLERAVKTASIWQVRQPIYTTSTEKWRRYANFLQPLEETLAIPDIDNWQGKISQLPVGYFFQGMSYLQQKRSKRAERVFRQILAENPHHAAACHMLGVALFQQGRLKPALQAMQESLRRHPNQKSWYQNLNCVRRQLGMIEIKYRAIPP